MLEESPAADRGNVGGQRSFQGKRGLGALPDPQGGGDPFGTYGIKKGKVKKALPEQWQDIKKCDIFGYRIHAGMYDLSRCDSSREKFKVRPQYACLVN